MIIRYMQEEDVDQVHAIETKIFTQPWSRSDFLECIANTDHIYLVVEEDNKIIAYCGMWSIAGEGQINNVGVAKEHQNKSIGYQMLNTLIEEGRARGLAEYTLEVRISNEPARRLYQRLGFKESGVRKDFYDLPKEDAVIMWLTQE